MALHKTFTITATDNHVHKFCYFQVKLVEFDQFRENSLPYINLIPFKHYDTILAIVKLKSSLINIDTLNVELCDPQQAHNKPLSQYIIKKVI